ncbi:MAG: hypothetical protein ABSF18_02560, partial [Gammaproteobacteria bacterium]
MKKLLTLIFFIYSTTLWAGLGDPYTYTLAAPQNSNLEIPPTPFDLKMPPRPDTENLAELEPEKSFNVRLSSLRRPHKIRVENAPGIDGMPVLCHVQITKDLCQANYLGITTDYGGFTRVPLNRLNPETYAAVAGFADYFDLHLRGTTPCTLMVSCDY